MMRICVLALLSVFLSLPTVGCSWLEKQNVDVCVDYKGRHVCVSRKDGKWTFSADLNKEEQAEIIESLGK